MQKIIIKQSRNKKEEGGLNINNMKLKLSCETAMRYVHIARHSYP